MADTSKAARIASSAGLELIEIVRLVPRMLGRTVLGWFAGGAIGTVVGVVLLLVSRTLGWGAGSGWVAWSLATASVVAFALGGCTIGALRGCAAALARSIDERRWVERLWAQIRPHLPQLAQRVHDGITPAEARDDAMRALQRKADATDVPSLPARTERYVAELVHQALAGVMLTAATRTAAHPDGWHHLEAAGLEVAREAVGDLVARMFHSPAIIALVLTIVAAAAPHALATAFGG